MVIEELTRRECHAILERATLARLACSRANQPYIVPVHVDFHDGALYGFAPMGQKIEWMRENPLVCLEIEELNTDKQWATVLVFGRYEELPDLPDYEYHRTVAEGLFQRHPMWWEPGSIPLAAHQPRPRVLFRILVCHLTGRRAGPDAPQPRYLLRDENEAGDRLGLRPMLRRVLGRQ